MEIKRLSKWSNIIDASMAKDKLEKVIQIVCNDDATVCFIEYIPEEYIDNYIAEQSGMTVVKNNIIEPVKSEADKELETALDTQLLNDPLGKYNGCNLRVPFDRKDTDWIDWCLKNMHNKYIRDKIQLIKNSGYGA